MILIIRILYLYNFLSFFLICSLIVLADKWSWNQTELVAFLVSSLCSENFTDRIIEGIEQNTSVAVFILLSICLTTLLLICMCFLFPFFHSSLSHTKVPKPKQGRTISIWFNRSETTFFKRLFPNQWEKNFTDKSQVWLFGMVFWISLFWSAVVKWIKRLSPKRPKVRIPNSPVTDGNRLSPSLLPPKPSETLGGCGPL